MRSPRWNFRVDQGGMTVAEGDAPDAATACREAAHYAMMYGQDGPVIAHVWQHGSRAPTPPQQEGSSR